MLLNIEEIAKAMYNADYPQIKYIWEDANDSTKSFYISAAKRFNAAFNKWNELNGTS